MFVIKDNKSFESVSENIGFYPLDEVKKIGVVGDDVLYRFSKKIVTEKNDITVNGTSNHFYFVDLFDVSQGTITNIIDLRLSWQTSDRFYGSGYMTAPDSKGMSIIGYYIDIADNKYRLVVAFRNSSSTPYVISGGLPDLFVSVDYV